MRLLKRFLKNGWVIASLILILTFPVLVNFTLLTWKSSLSNGDTSAWMGFIASYYGAIFGGVISGAVTLIGILIGFRKGDIDKFESTYYTRKTLLYESKLTLQSSFINLQHLPPEEGLAELIARRDLLNDAVKMVQENFPKKYRLFSMRLRLFNHIDREMEVLYDHQEAFKRYHEQALEIINDLDRLDRGLDKEYDSLLRS